MTEKNHLNTVPRDITLGFAQRKSNLFFAWFAPLALAVAGVLYALPAMAMGDTQDVETGFVAALIGLILSGLGWLVSAPKRFSKKKLKPATDIPRVDQAIRIHPGTRIANFIILGLIVIGLCLSPNGITQDMISIGGLIIGIYAMIMLGMECSYRWLKNSGHYYEAWINKRK